jgi:tetratricopeptide (TPR) repeat protein
MGFPWAGEGGGGSLSVYLVRRGEEYRAVGVSNAWSTIGSMLLRWVEEERLEPARRWLDWIIEEISGTGGSDELDSMPVRWLWSAESERDADDIRLAAASLMSDGTYGDRPIAILRDAAESRADSDSAVGIDLALAIAARSVEDYDLQLEAAARLVAAYPRSPAAFLLRVGPLIELKRFDAVEREVSARRKRLPGDPLASSIYADIPRMTGNLAENRRRLVALTTSGKATAGEYNNLAWLDIVEENVTDESLRLAQQAVAMTEYSQVSSLHTLATVYAELRRVTEARDVLLALLENRPSSDLASPDWYILGRIAEEYGVVDAALEAYERVESPEGGPDASSTFALATRRIAALSQGE